MQSATRIWVHGKIIDILLFSNTLTFVEKISDENQRNTKNYKDKHKINLLKFLKEGGLRQKRALKSRWNSIAVAILRYSYLSSTCWIEKEEQRETRRR